MKLFILAFLSVILAVSSESENVKRSTKDQKSDDSAFLQKFLPPMPLHHNINQRYGVNYGMNGIEHIENLLRNDHRYYDYIDDHDEDTLRQDGGLRGLYNAPNIWGYSRNGGGLGHIVNHAYNGDPNVWGYLRNSEGRMRNMGPQPGQNIERPRNEGRPRNLGNVYMRPGNREHVNMMGPEIMGYGNMGRRNMGHGPIRLGNIHNLNALLEPDHIGYVGQVSPGGRGIKDRYSYAMVVPRELHSHRRTGMSHGMSTPMTPSLLGLVGLKNNPHMHHSG